MWLKTLYRKRAVTWPFIFYTIIWTLSRIASKTTIINSNSTEKLFKKRLKISLLDLFFLFCYTRETRKIFLCDTFHLFL
ncbi:hypothetical protein CYQ56_10385 [Enterococcus faecium]|nr:hypothetical protein CYQ76_10450 [Enterococcus faecium]RXW87802.1 hypothetical protein CYQ61_10495 [Enterococcus faecium]RXX02293.1 hypothetical protein CYQ56_10385 [Enterococcus faecium]TKN12413.1 hypothetical protein DVW70_10650 [Enterococcus faecium]TKN21965.1 hypothetical protein DVW73_10635 [Enterococcus faecium]